MTSIGIDIGSSACRAALPGQGGDGWSEYSNDAHPPSFRLGQASQDGSAPGDAASPNLPLITDTAKARLDSGELMVDRKGYLSAAPRDLLQNCLAALVEELQEALGRRVIGAGMGLPAAWGMQQRSLLRQVAAKAGLSQVMLVDEAAATARYCLEGESGLGEVLVVDMGRAFCGATLLDMRGDEPLVVQKTGSANLGGQDFEGLILYRLALDLLQSHGIELTRDHNAMQRLAAELERVKIELDSTDKARIRVGPIRMFSGQVFQQDYDLARGDMETMIEPWASLVVDMALGCLRQAKHEPGGVDRLLLAGSGWQVPLLRRKLLEALPMAMTQAPPQAVARGVALMVGGQMEFLGQALEPAPGPVPLSSGGSVTALARKAQQAGESGDRQEAIRLYELLTERAAKELSRLYSQKGGRQAADGDLGGALLSLETGLAHWPGNQDARTRLAEVHAGLAEQYHGRRLLDQCRNHLNQGLRLDPQCARALELLRRLGPVTGTAGSDAAPGSGMAQ